MAIFATVVDQGTFRAAAKHLGLAPSRISQAVSDLEQDLGVTLLYRSTRQLSLTNEGHILYAKVSEMMQAAEVGLNAINTMSDQPAGELSVTAPAFITQTKLMDAFAAFAHAYPNTVLKLSFSDHQQDLINEGFDVGIRAGWLKSSDLMTRNLATIDRVLVASPDYYASMPAPGHPKDLEAWHWLHFSMRPDRAEFFSDQGDQVTVVCKHQIEVDSAQALYEFALRGLGITPLPKHLADKGFKHGELIPVLPDWYSKPLQICAVWPDRSRRESLALKFVRFLAEHSQHW